MTQAHPLHWPAGWPRTPPGERHDSKYWFRRGGAYGSRCWTFAEARDALYAELDRLGAVNVIVSTNFRVLASGIPTDSKGRPEDQGVAVYFTFMGKSMVMARDAHLRAEENMRSLALAIEAMRQLDRHGGSMMVEKAFTGFEQLPAPGQEAQRHWRQVFGLAPGQPMNRQAVEVVYRNLARERHPDRGGSVAAMAELNRAREEALAEVK